MFSKHPMRGMTFVEVIISIGIIAILMSLLIPAVQSSRAQSRKLICTNNLRQICLATFNFHEAEGRLPFAGALQELLPYLEQDALHEALVTRKNTVALLLSPPVVLCPDRQLLDSYPWYVSYCMNDGGTIIPRSGLFGGDSIGKLNEATDGLSNTMMLSERMIVPFIERISFSGLTLARKHERLVYWSNDQFFGHGQENEYLEFVQSIALESFEELQSCLLMGASLYDHLAPPNRNVFTNGLGDRGVSYDMTPATSHHFGGVNAARCDGSVSFVSNDIDPKVWRALGTVNRADLGIAD